MLTRKCGRMYVRSGPHRHSVLSPHLNLQNPIIPVTVQDQIRLWEMEKHRVKSEEGVALGSPKVFPIIHVPSGQAISTKTFPLLATTRLFLSTRRIWASCGGPTMPNECSLRTEVEEQRFGSLLRGESLVEHSCGGPWTHLILSSDPIWRAEIIPQIPIL